MNSGAKSLKPQRAKESGRQTSFANIASPPPAWSLNVDEIRGGLGGLRRHTFCHTKCAKLARMAIVGKSKPLKSIENLIENFMASPNRFEQSKKRILHSSVSIYLKNPVPSASTVARRLIQQKQWS